MADLESFNIKKIFTETESLIWKLYDMKRLTEQERDFLWQLLGRVKENQNPAGLFEVLQEWLDANTGSVNDQIIKATLLAMNMEDLGSVEFNLELLWELMGKTR